jgi:hypothetical protein
MSTLANIGRLFGRGTVGAIEQKASNGVLGNISSNVFSGLTFAGRQVISLTTQSLSTMMSLGGGLLLFLLSQARRK